MKSILNNFNKKIYSVAFLLMVAVFFATLTLYLSLWQFDRAKEKQRLETRATVAQYKEAVPLPPADDAIDAFMQVIAVGVYLPEFELFLDNRTYQKKAGYDVITPLQLQDGRVVVVKRGWVGHGGNRQSAVAPAPPSGLVTVTGALYFDNSDAFVLSDVKETEKIRQRIVIADYAADINHSMVSLILIQQLPKTSLVPVSVRVNFKSQRSIVYAWQWLSLFCLIVFISVFFGFKYREK